MSNAMKGVIEARTGDGQVFKLLFDFNTWVDAEEATGLKAQELLAGLKDQSLSAKQQRALFWCALKEHHPELTERDAGRLLVELSGALERALKAGMPEDEPTAEEDGEEAAADPPAAAHGTGSSS